MQIKDKFFSVPVIQGGMGIGVSLSRLAGTVASCGGIGTISAVSCGYGEEDFWQNPVEANLRVLAREIKKAKEIAGGMGLIAVNIMVAVTHYEEYCRCAVENGADLIVSGAGLPLRLPEYVKGSKTLFAPIVSSAKAALLLCKKYQKQYGILPDLFILEGHKAGGHLGFSADELESNQAKDNDSIFREIKQALKDYQIPIFVGGGVFNRHDVEHFLAQGAAGVQLGTRFITTEECDAAPGFKEALIRSKEENIQIIKSPVGMPARAIISPMLERVKAGEGYPAQKCINCLTHCKKGSNIPYCINRALIEAVKGNWENGLFFTGENGWRTDRIMGVKELMNELYPVTE